MKKSFTQILAISLLSVAIVGITSVVFLYINYSKNQKDGSEISPPLSSKYISQEDQDLDLSKVDTGTQEEEKEENPEKEGVLEVREDRQVLGMSKELTDDEKESIEEEYGVTFVDEDSTGNVYIVESNEESKIDELKESDVVDSVETDVPVKMFADKIDWGISKIGASQVWDSSTGSGVTVAVIDTGIQLDHPDISGNIVSGYDFVNDDTLGNDDNGHGTHVAGIVSAMSNGTGTVGAGYSAKLMPVKVLNSSGYGYLSDVAKGIYFATDNGARIINMSLGSSTDSDILKRAVTYASSKGVLLVAAAGNDYGAPCSYPAAYSSVICVVATDPNNKLASFSNVGGELAAPGVSNYSTYAGSTYKYMSGTSMASPHVAGAAAVVMSVCDGCTTTEVRNILRENTVDLGEVGQDIIFGYGLVDLVASIDILGLEEEIVDEIVGEEPVEEIPEQEEPEEQIEQPVYVRQYLEILEPELSRNNRYIHKGEEDIVIKFRLTPDSSNSSLEKIVVFVDNKEVYSTTEQNGEYTMKLEDLRSTQYFLKIKASFSQQPGDQKMMIVDLTDLATLDSVKNSRGRGRLVLGISTFLSDLWNN